MNLLAQLWLPILLSAVAVWFASALGWMLIGHHNKDHKGLPDEKAVREAIRAWKVPPGTYMFPYCTSHKDASAPEHREKFKEGPNGMLRIWAPVNMGVNMALTFLVSLVVSTVVGYLGSAALHPGDSFAHVFQVLGTAGVLAYTTASLPNDIWFQRPGRAIVMSIIDGLVFGLVTGAVFAWLWPKS